jgi:clan AA aspartic protease (TIGR02281 family)
VCPPPSTVTSGDQVALPYEGQGHSLAIPVSFGDTEFPMMFDTGATVSTLTTDALRKLGIVPGPEAPVVTLRTANGARDTRLVLVDEVWIGGFQVKGVTVGVCDECGDSKTYGLLGLNVSGQFLVTLDTARKEVVLTERGFRTDRLLDVGPWLDVAAQAAIYPDDRVEVTVTAHNRSDRAITEARVGVRCGKDAFVVELLAVPPKGDAEEVASLPRGTRCDAYRVQLESAQW